MSITKINNIFHLSNTDMSYLIKIMPNGQLEQLYFGPTLALKEDDTQKAKLLALLNMPKIAVLH